MKLGNLIRKADVRRCGSVALPILSMTMHDGIVEQSERFKKKIASKGTSSYKIVNPGQLVVGFPIDEGVIYVQNLPFPGIMSPAYNIWDIDESAVNPTYLELALHGPGSMAYYSAKMRGTTARRRSITASSLCNLAIPLPSMDEQAEIVGLFEAARTIIQNREKQLDLLDQLVKSQFVEMFGDPTKPNVFPRERLGSLYNVRSSKRIYAREQTETGVPFYRLADIGSLIDGLVPERCLYISEKRYEELEKSNMVPSANDVLVTARGTLGRCYIVNNDDRFYFQDGMITWLAQTKSSPLAPWIVELFANYAFTAQLNTSCSGTTVKYLSLSDLADVSIPVPPLVLQQEFADFVAQVNKSEFAVRQQIETFSLVSL